MHKNHLKAIKGMSIAALVLSALCIVSYIACIIMTSFASDLLYAYGSDYASKLYDYGDLGLFDMSYGHGHGYGYDGYPYGIYVDDIDDAMMVLPAVIALINGVLVFAILCSIVSLVASIIGLRLDGTYPKLRTAFVWFVIGAVAGGIALNVPVCVLFIIMAVFANSDRKYLTQMQGQPFQSYDPYGGQPNVGQPYGGQPNAGQPNVGQPTGGQPYGGQLNVGQPYGQSGQDPYAPPVYAAPEPPVASDPYGSAGTMGQQPAQQATFESQANMVASEEEIDVIIGEQDDEPMVIEDVEVVEDSASAEVAPASDSQVQDASQPGPTSSGPESPTGSQSQP